MRDMMYLGNLSDGTDAGFAKSKGAFATHVLMREYFICSITYISKE